MNKNRNSVKINPEWENADLDVKILAHRVRLRSQYLWMGVNLFCNPPEEVKQLISKGLYWAELTPEKALPILRELDRKIALYEVRDPKLTEDKRKIIQESIDIFVPPDMRPGCKSDYALNSVITWLNAEVKSHSNHLNNWNHELKNLISSIAKRSEEEKEKLNEELKKEREMLKNKNQEEIKQEEEEFINELAEQIEASEAKLKDYFSELEEQYNEETDPERKKKLASRIERFRKGQEEVDKYKAWEWEQLEVRERLDQPEDIDLGELAIKAAGSIVDILASLSIGFIMSSQKNAKKLFRRIKFRTWYLSAASRIISFIEFIIDFLVVSYVIVSIIKLFVKPIFGVPSPQTLLDIFNTRGVVLALGISLLKEYALKPKIKKKISQARWNLFDRSRREAFTAALKMMYIRASFRAQKKQAEGIPFGDEETSV